MENNNLKYNHTQTGYLMITIFAIMLIIFAFVLVQTEFLTSLFIFMIFMSIILLSFSTLNVKIDKYSLRLKFGYGLFQKKILIKDIVSAKTVKNKWYYGWGIKLMLFPTTWIYNVSGFDAVEVETKNKKRYRIGTDEPQRLERVILNSIKE